MDQQILDQVDQLLSPYFKTLGDKVSAIKTEVKVDAPKVTVNVPDIKIPEIKIPKIEVPKVEIPPIVVPPIHVPKPQVTVNVDKVKVTNFPDIPAFDDTKLLAALKLLLQKPAGGGGRPTEYNAENTFVGALTGTVPLWNDSGTLRAITASKPLPVTVISGGGGGTEYADGAARGTATGTLIMGDDGTNIQSIHVDSSGDLQIDVLTIPSHNVTNAGTFAVQADTELPTAAALADGVSSTNVEPRVAADMQGLRSDGTANSDRAILSKSSDHDTAGTTEMVVHVSPRVAASGGSVAQALIDNAGFTDTTSAVTPAGYIFDEVAGTALTENDIAAARLDSKRAQVFTLEDPTTRGQRQIVQPNNAAKVEASYSYSHMSTNTTTTQKSGAGVLHTIVINTRGTGSTATVYDNTAGSGTAIAIIDTTLSTTAFLYDVSFATGLTVVTAGAGAADITIAYR